MFKILVAEDEEGIRTTIVDILELADYDVLPTANGKEALKAIDRFVPDLIISDINMPEMDGFELLLSLRQNRVTHSIPCIFLTARVERKDFRHGMSIGADDYLTKPFTSEELLTAVHTRLERQKLLLSEIDAQVEELQLLRQMDQELSERFEPRWLMNMIFDWALRQSNANTAILFLKPTPDADLRAEHVYGRSDQLILQEGDTWGIHPLTDTVLLTSKTLLINNLNEVQGIFPIVSASQSVIAVPIIFGDVPMGVIVLESEGENGFDEPTVNLLEQMANRASVALQNARLFQQLSEQRKVEHNLRLLFQKFVSEEVVNALEDETVSTKEIDTKVAILFCDIRNFTSYSEKHSASEVVAMLNQYIPLVVQAARMHGGNVNKFGGDSVMIIFGAPNYLAEPSYQAILTALQIIQALPQVNKTFLKDSEFKLNIGVGINTGEVIAGTIGSDDRQEYTVIGDAVNLAARIESLNKQFTNHAIFITDYSYEDLGKRQEEFEMTNLGEIDIRGKAKPIKIWAVDNHKYIP